MDKIVLISAEFSHSSTETKKLIQELSNGHLNPKRAIYWYTANSIIYKFMNNLMRLSSDISQVFYIQPFFKDLFHAVHQLYNSQVQRKILTNFVCYRGGTINKKELEKFKASKGRLVKNLGFLSTSLKRQEAETFVSNVLFEITVDNSINPEVQNGYAYIANLSAYKQEQEVLFNPLNLFKVVQISETFYKTGSVTCIKLQFGDLNKMLSKPKQQLKLQ